jgi:hypothetical protein
MCNFISALTDGKDQQEGKDEPHDHQHEKQRQEEQDKPTDTSEKTQHGGRSR